MKNKERRITAWAAPAVALCLGLLAIALATRPALAVTVVTPSSPDGWAAANVRADASVAITTNMPRSGLGSLEFNTNTVTPGQDKADYQKTWNPLDFPDRTLGNISGVGYDVYRDSSSTTADYLAPVYRLMWYNDPGTPGDLTDDKFGFLIWEPAYNGYPATFPEDAWQSLDLFSGNWWMFISGAGVVQNYNSTLSDWITGTPTGQPGDPTPPDLTADTIIYGINVGVGSGWGSAFRGYVDNVKLNFGSADEIWANFEPDPVSYCPSGASVNEATYITGVGMGDGKKFKTQAKIVLPNSSDLLDLYGQLAGKNGTGVKYVRFIYPNNTKVQLNKPATSVEYQPGAVFWYGTDLDPAANIRGRWFFYTTKEKPPRAMVLYPTYYTEGDAVNVWKTFAESATNHVYWETGWNPTAAQTLSLPATQIDGANIYVQVAIVDVDGNGREVDVTIEAGGVIYNTTLTAPTHGKLLNIVSTYLENVPAGTDEVTITLESPTGTGDSAAMIGAAARYSCQP